MAFDTLSSLNVDEIVAAGRQVESALATQPDLAAALAPYGYDVAALAAAGAELDALEAAAQGQRNQYGLQFEATDDVGDARAAFHRNTYMPHAQIARVVFRDEPGTLARLGLDGEREEAFHAWAAQVRQFYATLAADAGLRTRLAARGVPAAALTAAGAQLDALAATEQGQENRRGLAQQSTRDRDARADAFERWLGDLRDTARIALRARPDWLERLGFLARSDEG